MWFGNAGYSSLGRITPSGHITSYSGGDIDGPFGVTEGPDGAMWFTNYDGNTIGRITMSGQVTTYPIPGGISSPQVITRGPGRDTVVLETSGRPADLGRRGRSGWYLWDPPGSGAPTVHCGRDAPTLIGMPALRSAAR